MKKSAAIYNKKILKTNARLKKNIFETTHILAFNLSHIYCIIYIGLLIMSHCSLEKNIYLSILVQYASNISSKCVMKKEYELCTVSSEYIKYVSLLLSL